ncbi:MAG TPA: hypothetical protein VGQ83_20255 [Polyangia bacterium]|jgi:hypothetical protein
MLNRIGLLAAVMLMVVGAAGCGGDSSTNQNPNGLNFGGACDESATDNTCFEVYCGAGQSALCDLAVQKMNQGDCHGTVSTTTKCPAADSGTCTLPLMSGYESVMYYYAPYDTTNLAAGCAASGGTFAP